ncbi:TetR family transcriptional regulator [Shimia isoporae]|uniref:TetR family transcriptional regulator n=1 Tax=Shimia isoporae TaxID=647720 RepID=A0A4R1NP71_9RHOB|nr:TetR/AcrR family transcriptional regulator [Shimia isoporae]TCL10015.1 TetR family transcriptional regulator [Shimia isoporae]
MTQKDSKKPHHHGDLRNALIKAGIEILEEGGMDALSLRKCAARAGVSHAAPAHHFDGLRGLKTAIAQEAFDRFSSHMTKAAEAEGESPRDRLRGICRGYLQFGLNHRALLDIIFGIDASDILSENIQPDDNHAYMILREACAPFVPAHTAPEVIEFQVWSLVHGYTQLFLSGRFGAIAPIEVSDGPFDEVMSLLDRIGTAPKS